MASAARRIKQATVNWSALAERVPEAQKSNFTNFKAKSDGYLRKMMAFPENPPKIDWAYYQSRVPVKGMVADFQKKYDALNVPYPVDNVSTQIDQQEKEILKSIQEFANQSNARIAEYEKEAARLRGLLPYENMTMEDFRDSHPDLALDPLNKPTYWPHTPEEQLDYDDPRATTEHH